MRRRPSSRAFCSRHTSLPSFCSSLHAGRAMSSPPPRPKKVRTVPPLFKEGHLLRQAIHPEVTTGAGAGLDVVEAALVTAILAGAVRVERPSIALRVRAMLLHRLVHASVGDVLPVLGSTTASAEEEENDENPRSHRRDCVRFCATGTSLRRR